MSVDASPSSLIFSLLLIVPFLNTFRVSTIQSKLAKERNSHAAIMDNVEERWKEKLMENNLKLEKRNEDEMSKLMFKIDKKDQTIQSNKEEKNKR